MTEPTSTKLIAITGGAGLVGQNLVISLFREGYRNILVIDKNKTNLAVLKNLNPLARTIEADLSQPSEHWQEPLKEAHTLIMLQAQISGLMKADFTRNSVVSTKNILDTITNKTSHIIHVSSSVVNSIADDYYVESKKEQEQIVKQERPDSLILRPTLMFGWFDRKHFGWLSRFMKKSPIFPIPGNGKFTRQPLYAGDFCKIIVSAIENGIKNAEHNISGHEKIDYIKIIETIKQVNRLKTPLIKIPARLFSTLLKIYALFDRNPPFTDSQLQALMTHEFFEEIDWEKIFSIKQTSFEQALEETLTNPKYSQITLEF